MVSNTINTSVVRKRLKWCDTLLAPSTSDGGTSTRLNKSIETCVHFTPSTAQRRAISKWAPLWQRRPSTAPSRSRRRSIRVKASIDIHGYLRERRRAVDGGRRKVDTSERGLRSAIVPGWLIPLRRSLCVLSTLRAMSSTLPHKHNPHYLSAAKLSTASSSHTYSLL